MRRVSKQEVGRALFTLEMAGGGDCRIGVKQTRIEPEHGWLPRPCSCAPSYNALRPIGT